jgi:hypothetical protein
MITFFTSFNYNLGFISFYFEKNNEMEDRDSVQKIFFYKIYGDSDSWNYYMDI